METQDRPPPPITPWLLRGETDQTLQEPSSQTELPSVTIVRQKRGRFQFHLQRQPQRGLKNNLSAGVGYLELANAGDFAANVWNIIPVPPYAVVFMAIGGAAALLMSLFALRDFRLSWANVRLLLLERERLRRALDGQREQEQTATVAVNNEKDNETVRLLRSRLGVCLREIGTEVIDRLIMDALGGVGAVLVGVGTIMAIWGANPTIFHASNLLSGYVGNSFTTLFGVLNAIWSAYLFLRYHRHSAAAARNPTMNAFRDRYRLRFFHLQCHAVINGLTGLVAGAASMVTATRWWGYVMLIPCILLSIFFNYFWRWKLGYDRPLWNESECERTSSRRSRSLFEELEYVTTIHNALVQSGPDSLSLTLSTVDTGSLESILGFIVGNGIFEDFCAWISRDDDGELLLRKLFPASDTRALLCITPGGLLKFAAKSDPDDDGRRELLLVSSRRFLKDAGRRVFNYRERYLLELAGYAVWRDSRGRE
ncbi:hypothetical protein MPDQ_006264 [Monascus purpureus]|uniref:Integral membrane protein n=1 Tax=Monascus purpureus TaxID=5098 RepID=A0A507QUT2_MONPU|nr:hypothetical protein MPDQ_006264 [Monascus purpureus]